MEKRVMLITGTSKGIGKYLAEYYLSKEYFVIGCSRSKSAILNKSYHHFIIDVSNEKEILDVFSYIRKDLKRLDVLINNAAINPAIISAALLPYDTILNAFKVNTFAPMVFCREAVKIMGRKKSGRIINIGSMATRHEVPGEALYTSTKSSVIAFSRVLAKEVYKAGITVNVIAPSAIDTELSAKVNKDALKEVLSRNAVNEMGQSSDVTNTIDFLISKESMAVTGQVIYLGGA
jgi:3-oxoacyl-[acyl-carrier protein] reductase